MRAPIGLLSVLQQVCPRDPQEACPSVAGQALPSPWCPGPSLWGPAAVGVGEGLQAAREAATPHEGLPRLGCPWGGGSLQGRAEQGHIPFHAHGQVLALRSVV